MNEDAQRRKARRDAIVKLLSGPDNAATIGEIVHYFRSERRAPESTIRNDVKRLVEQGRVVPAGVSSTGARCYMAVTE